MPLVGLSVVTWIVVAVGLHLGLVDGEAPQAPPGGRGIFEAVAVSDPVPGQFDWRVLIRLEPSGAIVVARFGDEPPIVAGDRLGLSGSLSDRPSTFRGRTTQGELVGAGLVHSIPPASPLRRAANAMRARIIEGLDPGTSASRALLAGFLVGDTTHLPRLETDALRRAGLSHFVAVSGSNVALFLAAWWLVFAPLAVIPQVRWALGLVGLAFFAIVTRGEPSVIRASVMAGIALVSRAAGLPMDAWSVLSVTVIGSLVVVPRFALDVGFGLSVAATAGVLLGARAFTFRPKAVATLLGASLGAQMAVAPILVAVFGSMPLLSPLANLAAAPIVMVSTGVGGVGALLGWGWVVAPASKLAGAVLSIAHLAAPWPQVGWGTLGVVGAAALVVLWLPSLRILAAPVIAVVVVAGIGSWSGDVERPAVVFLDVGQGDAALVLGAEATVLIDGGPDPVILDRALARYGVKRVDLLIATHVHTDHLAGLDALVGRRSVGEVWSVFEPHSTPASVAFLGQPMNFFTPSVGTSVLLGDIGIEVLGPARRFDNPNDQSLVVMVEVGGRKYLFPGDVEVRAQQELRHLDHIVLKVPHQGAATSDRMWLSANAGAVAVISVGTNTFGHPAEWVIETLRATGALVLRTDEGGDVIFERGGIRRRAGRRRRYG